MTGNKARAGLVLKLALLFLTSSLWACSTNLSPAGPDSAPPPQITTPLSTLPTNEGCGFQWASKELPDLTSQLDTFIKLFDSAAKARATAFGENCVYADGHATFGAMETDFYIYKPVNDLTNHEAFGSWILNVMLIIEALPDDLIAGPNPGFVEFAFAKSDTEQIIVRVPIQKWETDGTSKSGEELFKMFYTNP